MREGEPKNYPEQPKDPSTENKTEDIGTALTELIKLYLSESREKIKKIIPENRNFDILTKELYSLYTEIKIKSKNKNTEKNLADYLPPKCIFIKHNPTYGIIKQAGLEDVGDMFAQLNLGKGTREIKKIIFIPSEEHETEYRGFLLSLFHEIGHAWQKHGHPTTKIDDIKAHYEAFKRGLAESAQKARQEGGAPLDWWKEIKNFSTEQFLPLWYVEKIGAHQAKKERNAWAYALNKMRELEREGYDVFAGFDNVAQIKDFINFCLSTYDIDLLMKRLGTEEENIINKVPPKFNKKENWTLRVFTPDKKK